MTLQLHALRTDMNSSVPVCVWEYLIPVIPNLYCITAAAHASVIGIMQIFLGQQIERHVIPHKRITILEVSVT